ncbi:MAG: methyl-accepting chemotaxis protein [Rubrivivax sp.]|nr:methyl-accepting chemotaxis protein [Rubrivivax sp.]
MTMSIQYRLTGTLAALTLLIAGLALLAMRGDQQTVDAYQESRLRAVAPGYQLSTLARSLVRQGLSLSRLLVAPHDAGASQLRQDIAKESEVLSRSIQELTRLLPHNPELTDPVRRLQDELASYHSARQQTMTLLDASKTLEAREAYDSAVMAASRALRVRIDAEIEAVDLRTEARHQQHQTELRSKHQIVVALLVLVVLAAAWIGWRLLLGIMVPVQRMHEALQAIGNGDLTAKVRAYRADELGALAESINRMGTLLQDAASQAQDTAAKQQRETLTLRQGVDKLLQVTEAAAGGDLAQRAGALEGEEMNRLASSVDVMVGGLRQLVGNLQGSMLQIRGCTTDLTASVRDNQTTLAEQASSSTEVAATSTEMAQNANELAMTMRRVSETNDGALQRAEQGRESLQRLDRTIGQILTASADISSALGAIATKSTDITSVVTAITRVADQTNLLSLNAAIEAEKAGEYGQGFSVIAGEIRRLSDQTTEAAGHIEQIVREMHTAISASVLSMDRFNDQVRRNVDDVGTLAGVLTGVIESVESLAPRVESASESMRAQAEGAAQINEAIRQIHDSITHAHRSMRSTGDATDALNAVAQQLQLGISRFRLA